jgi:NAD-specific glutamate dehydrogenase
MNHEQIKRIVQEVFEKAKKGSVSHSKYALAKQVVKEIHHLNPKTLERAYSRYIEKNNAVSAPNPDTVRFFCKYIGYTDYEEYMRKKSLSKITGIHKRKSKERGIDDLEKNGKIKKKYTWSLTAIIAITNYLH